MLNFLKKKNRTQLTYEEAHNKAFSRFQKSSQILIWAGVLNFFGLIVAIIQLNTSNINTFNPFLCFSSNILAFKGLMVAGIFIDNKILWYIVSFLIAIISSVGMIILGVYAKQGKKVHLFMGVSLYVLDMFCTIPLIFIEENLASLWLIAGIHVIITAFLIVAIYEYFNIIKIAVKYGVIKEGGSK
jgi:hypothetical protein